jgi:hypothetical protein
MAKQKLTRFTIPQAEKEDSSQLYALNKSNPRGNINFVITDISQQKISLQLPVTFAPIDLTNFAMKGDILRHPHFRRLVGKGFIHLVSVESAEAAISNDRKVAKEVARILDVVEGSTDLVSEDFAAPLDTQVNAVVPDNSKQINPFAQNIVLRVGTDSVEDLITELDSKEDTLTDADVKFIMDNTSNADMKEWCSTAMADRREEEAEDED